MRRRQLLKFVAIRKLVEAFVFNHLRSRDWGLV